MYYNYPFYKDILLRPRELSLQIQSYFLSLNYYCVNITNIKFINVYALSAKSALTILAITVRR